MQIGFRDLALSTLAAAALAGFAPCASADSFRVLQPLGDKPTKLKDGRYYVPTTPETARWGSLPNADSKPVLTLPSGSVVIIDTVSHEGVLEDQGKDPVKFFGKHGVKPDQVLNDAKAIAASNLEHDFVKDGPHVIGLHVISLIGFVFSGVLGMWLLIGVVRSGRL